MAHSDLLSKLLVQFARQPVQPGGGAHRPVEHDLLASCYPHEVVTQAEHFGADLTPSSHTIVVSQPELSLGFRIPGHQTDVRLAHLGQHPHMNDHIGGLGHPYRRGVRIEPIARADRLESKLVREELAIPESQLIHLGVERGDVSERCRANSQRKHSVPLPLLRISQQ